MDNMIDEKMELAMKNFRNFVVEGTYAEKVQFEKSTQDAKLSLRNLLHASDEKRHEFSDLGWVAKFIPKKSLKLDHPAIIEELLCYIQSEAVSQTITLNTKKIEADGLTPLITDHKYQPTYYAKPTLNKLGKQFGEQVKEDFQGLAARDLIRRIERSSATMKDLDGLYRGILLPFQDMEKEKITFDIGSISKIANKPIFDIHNLFKLYGLEFLTTYGNVKQGMLNDWISIGAIPGQVLSANSYVEDIRMDFVVMTIEAESIAHNAFLRKRGSRKLNIV